MTSYESSNQTDNQLSILPTNSYSYRSYDMKRDMDLARQILLELEKQTYDMGWVDINIPRYSPEVISYHVMLLDEAGLIEAQDLSDFNSFIYKPKRLTWHGHEFLEASRDESRWKKAKTIMAEKAGGLSFEVVKQLLIQLTKESVLGV